jgi:hypothetical protein
MEMKISEMEMIIFYLVMLGDLVMLEVWGDFDVDFFERFMR